MDKIDIIRTELDKLYIKLEEGNYIIEDLSKIEKLESILEKLAKSEIQSLEKKKDELGISISNLTKDVSELKDIICMKCNMEYSGLFDSSNNNLGFGAWRDGDAVKETGDTGLFDKSNLGFGIYKGY